ncbi:MAG TPA: hypothetical protein VEI03_03525 [Stellaceae bacterium]|nr:hypothetical protein [Stellaceae bacterium]
MILTPIDSDRLPELLARFAEGLGGGAARAVLGRIARPGSAERAQGALAATHHGAALEVLARLAMAARPGSPQEDFSWDGRAARADTEAYVLLHEAAHYQLASPERRRRIDFGLGPGPETGNRAAAAAAASLHGLAVEQEEAMASLLGILWEAELGHPALASFLDQNWLEGAARPAAADHFRRTLAALGAGGFITRSGRPLLTCRSAPDGEDARPYSFTAPVRLET